MKTITFHEFCKQQIFRFAGRLGWPDPKESPAAVKDLISALEFRGSRGSESTAKEIIDTLVEGSPYCPTVPDILRVGQELRARREGGWKPPTLPKCEECGDSGWRQVEKDGYDFATACPCRKVSAA
jgi:hypothetical protein